MLPRQGGETYARGAVYCVLIRPMTAGPPRVSLHLLTIAGDGCGVNTMQLSSLLAKGSFSNKGSPNNKRGEYECML